MYFQILMNIFFSINSCDIFHWQGGPYYELLHSLLGAYACYRPDVGYVSTEIPLISVYFHNISEFISCVQPGLTSQILVG